MNKTTENLIPNTVNQTPDYYCTWQTQLYATCDGKPERQRAVIGERALFDSEKPFGWAHFYKDARRDLIFVMDDSWDVPLENDGSCYGSLVLNAEKFPLSVRNSNSNADALKALAERIRSLGWKGLGGWVCAQESKKIDTGLSPEAYWKKRAAEAAESGFTYWKVDWGEKECDVEFRKMLTDVASEYAPSLTVEHSKAFGALPFCKVFRTYDVPAIMSIPMTLKKLADLFTCGEIGNCTGIINCEDEAYIAAAGGFSMGIMRHPFGDAFPNGAPDMSFPSCIRNLKTKIYEVTRAARWHRVAPAFSGGAAVSPVMLTDTWNFVNADEEIEAWWFDMPEIKSDMRGSTLVKRAPAQIARNCEFADVVPDKNGDVPYIISSANTNGVFSIATLGRTQGRTYGIPLCDVTVNVGGANLVGVFGEYKTLCIKTEAPRVKKVLMQDIADGFAYDVTDEVERVDGCVIVSGELIRRIGTSAQPKFDTSEPGAAIKLLF